MPKIAQARVCHAAEPARAAAIGAYPSSQACRRSRISRFPMPTTRTSLPGGAVVAVSNRCRARRVNGAARSWAADLAKIKGKPVVAYHTSWRYLAEYTGMNIVGFMEPKPGVPPSPAHLAGLIQTMKQTGAKVIVMEPFYDRKMADVVARQTGAKVLVIPPSVGGSKGLDDYIQLLTSDIQKLAAAL